MAIQETISENCYVTKEGVYLYAGEELDTNSLMQFINENRQRSAKYNHYYDLYSGNHDILHKPHYRSFRPDNRIISNWANYVVDT